MPKDKVVVMIDKGLLRKLDRLVAEGRYPDRSAAVEEALNKQFAKVDRARLAREAAKLDPAYEQALADEGIDTRCHP
jgi:Arc/MetJ-type ribon-helix-helix transcriptional regulator